MGSDLARAPTRTLVSLTVQVVDTSPPILVAGKEHGRSRWVTRCPSGAGRSCSCGQNDDVGVHPIEHSGGDSKSSVRTPLGSFPSPPTCRARRSSPPRRVCTAAPAVTCCPLSRLAAGCSLVTALTPRVRSAADSKAVTVTVIRHVRCALGRTPRRCSPICVTGSPTASGAAPPYRPVP